MNQTPKTLSVLESAQRKLTTGENLTAAEYQALVDKQNPRPETETPKNYLDQFAEIFGQGLGNPHRSPR